MSRSKVLHEFAHRGEHYRIAEPAMGRRPHLLQREDDGDWFLDHEPDERLADEILRLRGLLEEVSEHLYYDPDDRGVLGNLHRRIRQALGREEGAS